jgi:hypothetical protein
MLVRGGDIWRRSFNRGGGSVSAGATRLEGASDAVSTRVFFERVHSLDELRM